MKASKISISKSGRGTTIRASGDAANALFNAMAAKANEALARRPAVQTRFHELKRENPNTPDAVLQARAKAQVTAAK